MDVKIFHIDLETRGLVLVTYFEDEHENPAFRHYPSEKTPNVDLTKPYVRRIDGQPIDRMTRGEEVEIVNPD